MEAPLAHLLKVLYVWIQWSSNFLSESIKTQNLC